MEENDLEVVPEHEVKNKRSGKINRMRNLGQYKGLSDEEFDRAMEKKQVGLDASEAFEKQIAKKLAEFEVDYDLSDLKINDRDLLRALIQKQLRLEAYEQHLFKIQSQGISESLLPTLEKFQKAMSDLTADISKIQNDLMITRKVRKSDKEATALAYLESLKDKAKRFYESKMSYVFCEKCNMLLGTFWTLFPEEERNKIALVCNRTISDGSRCGHKTLVGTKELIKNRGTNNPEITPESML